MNRWILPAAALVLVMSSCDKRERGDSQLGQNNMKSEVNITNAGSSGESEARVAESVAKALREAFKDVTEARLAEAVATTVGKAFAQIQNEQQGQRRDIQALREGTPKDIEALRKELAGCKDSVEQLVSRMSRDGGGSSQGGEVLAAVGELRQKVQDLAGRVEKLQQKIDAGNLHSANAPDDAPVPKDSPGAAIRMTKDNTPVLSGSEAFLDGGDSDARTFFGDPAGNLKGFPDDKYVCFGEGKEGKPTSATATFTYKVLIPSHSTKPDIAIYGAGQGTGTYSLSIRPRGSESFILICSGLSSGSFLIDIDTVDLQGFKAFDAVRLVSAAPANGQSQKGVCIDAIAALSCREVR